MLEGNLVSIANNEGMVEAAAAMVWADLLPAGCEAAVAGWTEQLRPGVSVLIDETGEEASHWLSALAGCTVPSRGRVQCADLCSQTDSTAYQSHVYWHNPRAQWPVGAFTAAQWVQQMAQRWPTWSDAEWALHSEGFELGPHMAKPLGHLSTGCLRKLGIAAALASGARLTLIEEPIAGLDRHSIRYLSQALDKLGEVLASQNQPPRWIVVAHWEPLASVTWDEVLAPPSLSVQPMLQ